MPQPKKPQPRKRIAIVPETVAMEKAFLLLPPYIIVGQLAGQKIGK
jgi:hypothetical protein